MKIKSLSLLLITTLSLQASAEERRGSSRGPAILEDCKRLLSNPQEQNDQKRAECQALAMISRTNGEALNPNQDETATMDTKITCKKKASYTIDYNSCVKAAKTYDWIKVTEQGLTLMEQVRTDNVSKSNQEEVARRSAQGDGQQAAIDSTVKMNNHLKQLNQERAAAYSAAVAALGTAVFSWAPTKEDKIGKNCQGKKLDASKIENFGETPSIIAQKKCEEAMKTGLTTEKSNMVANEGAKSKFILALTEFIALGVKHGIAANQFKNIANKLEGAKEVPTEEDTIMLDKCNLTPYDPSCIKPGSRVSGQGYLGGDFSMGEGNNNSFNMGDGVDNTFGEEGLPTNIDEGQKIAGVNSPFMDEAKQANSILNPASAASPGGGGGGAAGGGGGGGGGGLGGGSASLGDDLQGVDDNANKENEIKAKKAAGNYGGSGAKGFGAVKDSKEENPFASLFDSKGAAGGVEEDRSIASGDIDGQASGLFQKISRRYGQVQADKRIEANNLE